VRLTANQRAVNSARIGALFRAIVPKTQAEFPPRILKGHEVSNPPLSASQSAISACSAETLKLVRPSATFLLFEGTGERHIHASVADLCANVSVEN
jgi:hypothetical protein